ncbi:MAG: FUN14 domain-containing protein [Candidatus Asgardarchaeia archaeon]
MELLAQLGMGGIAGFVLGYALKKIFKVFLILAGLYLATLIYLANNKYIEINYEKFFSNINENSILQSFQSMVSIPVAGFAVGFLLGFKAG